MTRHRPRRYVRPDFLRLSILAPDGPRGRNDDQNYEPWRPDSRYEDERLLFKIDPAKKARM